VPLASGATALGSVKQRPAAKLIRSPRFLQSCLQ
jgi:hypothetical protein